jgi:peroxiredoxin
MRERRRAATSSLKGIAMSQPPVSIRLGDAAPAFTLPDVVRGEPVAFGGAETLAPCTCVVFMCNHCPYVHFLLAHFVALTNDYRARGVCFLAVSANDVASHPQDAPQHMQALSQKMNFGFPYLYDASQAVAKAYGAVCTPEFFVIDAAGALAYHGRYGAARPGVDQPGGEDLRAALDAVLDGRAVDVTQYPSIGCSIKWKA